MAFEFSEFCYCTDIVILTVTQVKTGVSTKENSFKINYFDTLILFYIFRKMSPATNLCLILLVVLPVSEGKYYMNYYYVTNFSHLWGSSAIGSRRWSCLSNCIHYIFSRTTVPILTKTGRYLSI